MNNKIAIVILNYKTYQDTINLIYNLKKQVWFNDISIYVVDNGSDNGSIEKLKLLQKDILFNLIISKENLGFALGNNLGIKKAREDGYNFIVCSNSDIELPIQDNFINQIIKIYKNDNNISIIAPNIINSDGIHQNPFREYRFSQKDILKMKFFYLTGFYKLYYFIRVYIIYNLITYLAQKNKIVSNNSVLSSSAYIYAPHGSFLIFTPSFFDKYNGFDKNTFLYCEEFILAERLRVKNLKCWFENSLNVIHKESQTTNKITNNYKEKVKFTLKHTFDSCRYFAKIIKG